MDALNYLTWDNTTELWFRQQHTNISMSSLYCDYKLLLAR